MKFSKVIKVKLLVNNEQYEQLQSLTEKYRDACNYVSNYVFSHDFELNSNKLNKLLYHSVRSSFCLKANLTQSTFRTVTARYKAVKEQMANNPFRYCDENGKWQQIPKTLDWLWQPICFKRPQADLVRGDDYTFVEQRTLLSVNTLGDRIKVPFCAAHVQKYFDGSWKFGTAKLVNLNRNWFLHISVTKTIETFDKAKVKHVVGIDRGLRFLAVSYDEKGKSTFFSGREVARKRQKFAIVRAELQQKHTRSAYRALKRISGRENRWMSDVNHKISKTLVQKYGKDTLFVIEDLTGISFRDEYMHGAKERRKKRSWSFYQLEQFLTYKANEYRSKVLKVSARYTSQRCPKCGSVHKESRNHQQHSYCCQNCGYRSNDDRIGAMNLQLLGTDWISGIERPKIVKNAVME